jgi:photosystem II stability/assembly factor-like uncharacterized protein
VSTATETIIPTPTQTPAPTAIPLEWRRQDSGQFLNRDQVMSVLIDPSDPDVMYAGMARSGVFKTIDGGISWFPIHNGLNRGWIHNMVINSENPEELYAGTLFGGLYRTENGGESWQRLKTGTFEYWHSTSFVTINTADPSHLAYTAGWNFTTSVDGGETWQNISMDRWRVESEDGLDFDGFMNSVAINPRSGDLILTGADPTRNSVFIFISEDGGRNLEIVFDYQGTNNIGTVLIHPNQEEMYYFNGGIGTTYRSLDGGRSWQPWNQAVEPLVISPDGVLYAAYQNGVSYSENSGQTWNFRQVSDFEVQTLFASKSNPNTLAAGGRSVFVSKDGGLTWEERGNGLGAAITEIGHSDSVDQVFLKEQLCRFECYGDDVRFFDFNLSTGESEFITPRECGTNPGSPWEASLCANISFDEDRAMDRYDVSPADPNIVYGNYGPTFHRSIDGGNSWMDCQWNLTWLSQAASAIALHPTDPETVYVATTGGLGITHDGCKTWVESEGIDTPHINTVALDPIDPNVVYVGTDVGVYISYNEGETWGKVNDGLLGALVIYSISIDPINSEDVYASTPYGIFKLESK